MRIAGNTVMRRYMHNLERNMGRKNREENKMYSYRQFNRASENPIQAARALRVRKALYDIETHRDNLRTANSIYESAESSVMKVSTIMQSVYEALIKGAHGTLNADDAGIVADTIDQYAMEVVQLMNVVVADRRIFGGTNNTSLAYRIEEGPNGFIAYYHGVPVNQYQEPSLFPFSGTSYTDIGIGMRMDPDTGRVDPQSAMAVTFNGAEILGCGLDSTVINFNFNSMGHDTEPRTYSVDVSIGVNRQTVVFTIPPGADNQGKANAINEALMLTLGHNNLQVGAQTGLVTNNIAGKPSISIVNTPPDDLNLPAGSNYGGHVGIQTDPSGFSGNVIQLMLDAAKALKDDNRLLAAQYADALFALQTNVSLTIAKIGNVQEFIEFNLDRTTNLQTTLTQQQVDLEAAKPEEQITKIKVLEAIFNASLQMGAQLIPMSIFNFIR